MKLVKEKLSSKFDIKDLGKLSYFLGIGYSERPGGNVDGTTQVRRATACEDGNE